MRPSKLTSALLARKGSAQAISADTEIATLYRFPADSPTVHKQNFSDDVAPRSATEAKSRAQASDCGPPPDKLTVTCALEPKLYLQLDLVAFAQNRSFDETLLAALESYAACNLPARAHPLCEHLVKARKAAVAQTGERQEELESLEDSEKE
jgi:hypothetical protein